MVQDIFLFQLKQSLNQPLQEAGESLVVMVTLTTV